VRVLVPPVLVGDRICRIVSPVDSLLEVEEWMGAWWEPSTIPLTTASTALRAPDDLLRDRGVPADDCVASEVRPDEHDIQAMLLIHDPDRPAQMRFDEDVVRVTSIRARKYPGNARFSRRPASAHDDTPDTTP
jgi:hypothetical protein